MKGFCNPSCTEQVCALNQGTKKDVSSKIIADLFVTKRLPSSEDKNVDKIPREEVRMKELSAFDPELKVIDKSVRMVFQTFFIRSK